MKRMLVNANDSEECRIAIVEDGTLTELHVEIGDRESYLGNIYKGKVVNIEPSIGAAFVSFGGNRNGFLHASDVVPAYADADVSLLDILEGRIRAGRDEGPEAVRSVLSEDGDPGDRSESAGMEASSDPGRESEAVPMDAEPVAEGEMPSKQKASQAIADDEMAASPREAVEPEGESSANDDSEAREEGPKRRRRRSRSTKKENFGEDLVEEVVEAEGSDSREATEASGEGKSETVKRDGGKDEKGRRRSRRRGSKKGSVQDLGKTETGKGRGKKAGKSSRSQVPIQDLLKKGQEVIVQITKEGIGAKGPTLTTYLSLPGRCLVLMPSLPKCGVSRKIADDKERRRLKRIVRELDETGHGGIGFIVRTAGVGKSALDVERDLEYLTKLWSVVVKRAKGTRAPASLYVESDLVLRTMRDHFTPDISDVVIDSEPVHARVKDFVGKLMPKFTDQVKHHTGYAPLFHAYGIETAVESLYKPKVDLGSGASIVIEQTEALVAIDVNSGKFKPGSTLEETAYRTNLDAIPEIVRQLRLRDLGGLIIVDFIDMLEDRHRRNVERKFRDALRGDRARINTGRISGFGLLELTRQRVGPGLKRTVFQSCPTCHGTTLVRTVQSKALAVLRELRALAQLRGFAGLEAYLHPEVDDFLENRKRRSLISIEDERQIQITLKAQTDYPVDVVHYRFLDPNGKEVRVNIPAGLGVHL